MARVTHYDVGDIWVPQATFTVNGTPTDPTNLTVRQQDAAGVETVLINNVATAGLNSASVPVAKVSAGVYKLNPGITFDKAGYWFVRFQGTGTAAASEESQAIVDPSEFTSDGGIGAQALVGLSETKDWLQRQNIDTGEDLDLVRIINDMSDRFQYEAGREFKPVGTNPQTRVFEVEPGGPSQAWYIDGTYMGDLGPYRRIINVGDLASFTQVQVLGYDWTTVLETVSLSNVTGLPISRQPWEPIRKLELQTTVTALAPGMRISIMGNWGFPSVPGSVRQAVMNAVAATMDRDVENYSQDLSGSIPNAGEASNTIVIGGSQRLLSLPPASLAVAWSYRDLSIA